MIIANEARIIVLLKTPPKSRNLRVNADCCVKGGYRVKWYTGRLSTQRFVETLRQHACCRNLKVILKPATLLFEFRTLS